MRAVPTARNGAYHVKKGAALPDLAKRRLARPKAGPLRMKTVAASVTIDVLAAPIGYSKSRRTAMP
jgi:hypothetical protein